MLSSFKLQLSMGQISRMILIMDEDMEGVINLQEYQDALEVYNCSGEDHSAVDGSDHYVSAEHRSVFKLLNILREKGVNAEDLMKSCGYDRYKKVTLTNLENVLFNISPEMLQKDTAVLYNFFNLDRTGKCQEKEFLS
jgi:hypothetical protein|tara:strand:+ start:493 stop:906 length:414 start_codon:yes stop_codon:yes gene_type:complete